MVAPPSFGRTRKKVMATDIGTYLKYGCGCLFAVHFGLSILVVFVVLIWLSVTEPFSAATAIGFSLVPLMGGGILAMGGGKGVSFDHETGRWMGVAGRVLTGFGAGHIPKHELREPSGSWVGRVGLIRSRCPISS